uniref:Uncharacterized protein n=1 Tax=Anguilla anguilla TaxID=7936 RepID=A0A0E9V3A2_ANGAN
MAGAICYRHGLGRWAVNGANDRLDSSKNSDELPKLQCTM